MSAAVPERTKGSDLRDPVESIRITGIAAGGAGVGRLQDGRAVFVHRTAPGDVADVAITERKSRWARGRLVRIRSASAQRRTPPCPLYAHCGGCTLQHLAPDAQRRAKAQLVVDAFQRIAHRPVEVPLVVHGGSEFEYRNRLSFTIVRSGQRVIAGFHRIDRPDRVLDVDDRCLLPEPAVRAAWSALRSAWGLAACHLPTGSRLRLTLRAVSSGAVTLEIEARGTGGNADELRSRVPGLAAIWQRAGPGEPATLLSGEATVEEAWGGESVRLSAGLFLQVNRGAAALLEEHVAVRTGDVDGEHVVDAYSGVGTRARMLARRGARPTAIELDAGAVDEARRLGGGPDYRQGRVEDVLPDVLPAHLVLLNPPRAGVAHEVSEALRHQPPKRIIYVSCDPATLARDVARLAPVFALRALTCFDLFPQTAHIETVAELACVTM